MAMREMMCPCEARFEREVPELVDLEQQPATIQAIRAGDFMAFACPECGKLLKPELPFRLIDRARAVDIFFVPELQRGAYLRGELEDLVQQPGRTVVGYEELVEKLAILEAGLDDRVVELIKYYLLSRALQEYADCEPHFLFSASESQALVFHVHGVREDEIGVTRIALEIYTKTAGEIESKAKEQPFDDMLAPPYVSVNKIYRNQPL